MKNGAQGTLRQQLSIGLPKTEVPTSKNAMMHIDRDVVGIFAHEANEFFALDLGRAACEICDVEFARLLS
jgi:hypothetical protein